MAGANRATRTLSKPDGICSSGVGQHLVKAELDSQCNMRSLTREELHPNIAKSQATLTPIPLDNGGATAHGASVAPLNPVRPRGHLHLVGVGFGIAIRTGGTVGHSILRTPGDVEKSRSRVHHGANTKYCEIRCYLRDPVGTDGRSPISMNGTPRLSPVLVPISERRTKWQQKEKSWY